MREELATALKGIEAMREDKIQWWDKRGEESVEELLVESKREEEFEKAALQQKKEGKKNRNKGKK
jgi:hypothetical protein